MAMNLSQLSRFMSRADHTLEGLFPATLRIAGLDYACTGVGGSAMLEYLSEGGQAPAGTKVFRVRKDLLPTRPETGTLVQWMDAPESVARLTVMDSPDRPHETSWVLRCAPTDR
jgi:hypothetical protein